MCRLVISIGGGEGIWVAVGGGKFTAFIAGGLPEGRGTLGAEVPLVGTGGRSDCVVGWGVIVGVDLPPGALSGLAMLR